MKRYVALTDFWHKNLFVPAETVISLAKSEVKYLGHVVEEFKARSEDVADEAKEAAGEIIEALKGRGEKAKAVDAKTETK